jgi:hypothetical protein
LETNRLILGGVDVNYLTRVQGNSKPRRGIAAFITAIPHHYVHNAMAAIGLVEGENSFAANRRDDGVIRTDGPEHLRGISGKGGSAGYGQGESARHGKA